MQVELARVRRAGEVRAGAAIFRIAEDRHADRRAMRAQLMRPPGNRQQCQPARALAGIVDDAVIGDRVFAFVGVGAHPFAIAPVFFGERQADPPLRGLRPADGERPIGLARRLVAKGPGQKRRRRGGAGDDENAARVLVEPMDEPRALGIAKAQGVEQPVEMPLGAGSALDREARRFVERDNGIVAMQDRRLQHRRVGRQYRARRGCGAGRGDVQWRHADRLSRHHPVAGFGALAVDPDLAGAQQLFEPAVSKCRVVPLEPAVEAQRAVVAGNGYCFIHRVNPRSPLGCRRSSANTGEVARLPRCARNDSPVQATMAVVAPAAAI